MINSSVPDKPAFTAFSGAGNRLDGRSSSNPTATSMRDMTEEEMVAQAIAMSLQEQTTSTSISDASPASSGMTEKERMRAERMAALEKRGLK